MWQYPGCEEDEKPYDQWAQRTVSVPMNKRIRALKYIDGREGTIGNTQKENEILPNLKIDVLKNLTWLFLFFGNLITAKVGRN